MQRGSKVSEGSKAKFKKTMTLQYLQSLDDNAFSQFVNEHIVQRYNRIRNNKKREVSE